MKSDLFFHFCRQPPVIGVKEGKPFSAGFLYGSISGGGYALVVLTNDFDLPIILGEKEGRFVGGAVVDDNNFKRAACLVKNRIDRAGYFLGSIIRGDQNADFHWKALFDSIRKVKKSKSTFAISKDRLFPIP